MDHKHYVEHKETKRPKVDTPIPTKKSIHATAQGYKINWSLGNVQSRRLRDGQSFLQSISATNFHSTCGLSKSTTIHLGNTYRTWLIDDEKKFASPDQVKSYSYFNSHGVFTAQITLLGNTSIDYMAEVLVNHLDFIKQHLGKENFSKIVNASISKSLAKLENWQKSNFAFVLDMYLESGKMISLLGNLGKCAILVQKKNDAGMDEYSASRSHITNTSVLFLTIITDSTEYSFELINDKKLLFLSDQEAKLSNPIDEKLKNCTEAIKSLKQNKVSPSQEELKNTALQKVRELREYLQANSSIIDFFTWFRGMRFSSIYRNSLEDKVVNSAPDLENYIITLGEQQRLELVAASYKISVYIYIISNSLAKIFIFIGYNHKPNAVIVKHSPLQNFIELKQQLSGSVLMAPEIGMNMVPTVQVKDRSISLSHRPVCPVNFPDDSLICLPAKAYGNYAIVQSPLKSLNNINKLSTDEAVTFYHFIRGILHASLAVIYSQKDHFVNFAEEKLNLFVQGIFSHLSTINKNVKNPLLQKQLLMETFKNSGLNDEKAHLSFCLTLRADVGLYQIIMNKGNSHVLIYQEKHFTYRLPILELKEGTAVETIRWCHQVIDPAQRHKVLLINDKALLAFKRDKQHNLAQFELEEILKNYLHNRARQSKQQIGNFIAELAKVRRLF